MEKKNDALLIPFVKPVRIGNYKLWRSRYVIKSGKERTDMECINVSNLEGSWSVRIPATATMFSVIANGYATVDEKLRDNFLGMLFTNIYNISTSASASRHDAFFILTEMMSFPYLLLPEKEMQKRMEKGMKDAGIEKDKRKAHIAQMMEYRRQLYELIERKKDDFLAEYERQQAQRREYARVSEEEDLKRDAIAEQAMEIAMNDDTTS